MTTQLRIYSISELTSQIKNVLENRIGYVWVEGEISNFTHHGSGHMYFSLKDENSQIRAVMFRGDNSKLRFRPTGGLKVLANGSISVYARSGDYQIIVKEMQPVGIGDLQLAYEQLKKKLDDEGLFDSGNKRPLPFFPKRIGIVTSPTGAAIRDIINVISRRCPGTELILAPVHVQGKQAAAEIARAIELFNQRGDVEVLIVGRGGGSLEDLWAFNEETVARAIHASQIPIVSAVGHEIDYTIADFVSDLRAPTPSAAAELVVPDKSELSADLADLAFRLQTGIQGYLMYRHQQLDRAVQSHGFRRFPDLIGQHQQHVDHQVYRLQSRVNSHLKDNHNRFQRLIDRLNGANPLSILSRGYAVCQKIPSMKPITNASDVKKRDLIQVVLATGALQCRVEQKGRFAQQTSLDFNENTNGEIS